MWLMLAGLAGVCGGGCRGEDLTAPRGAAPAPARVLVVADTLCVRAQFTITGPTSVTTNFPTAAECPSGLLLARSQPATWAQTPNRRLRLFVRFRNLTGQAVQLPVRLYLPATGTTVVLPAGTPPSKVVAYQPDSSEAGGGRVWFVGGSSVLAAGDSTAEDTLTFQVQSPVTKARWQFQATVASVGSGSGVPALPPDSISSATWLALHDTLNLEPASAAYPIPFPRNLILVTFRENTPLGEKQAAIDAIGGQVVGGNPIGNGGVYYVTIASDGTTTPLFNAIAQLKSLPQVLLATPELVPLSPGYLRPTDGLGWQPADWRVGPNDAPSGANWALEAIRGPLAWGCETGDSLTKVGVLDTQFDSLPEFVGIVDPSSAPLYGTPGALGHGTAVLSVLSANGNNGLGISGIMWRSRAFIREVATRPGDATSHTASGIVSLTRQGVRVINLSQWLDWELYKGVLGRNRPVTADTVHVNHILRQLVTAIRNATGLPGAAPPLIVLIAGNKPIDAYMNGLGGLVDTFPQQVLVVGGSDSLGQLYDSSGRGPRVELVAPAVGVATLDRAGTPRTGTGTSVAAPLVSGVAGLLLSFDPTLTAAQLKTLLVDGAVIGGSTAGGIPILNAYESLRLAAQRPGAPVCGNRMWRRGLNVVVRRTPTVTDTFRWTAPDTVIALLGPHGGKYLGARNAKGWLFQGGQWVFTQAPTFTASGVENSRFGFSHDADSSGYEHGNGATTEAVRYTQPTPLAVFQGYPASWQTAPTCNCLAYAGWDGIGNQLLVAVHPTVLDSAADVYAVKIGTGASRKLFTLPKAFYVLKTVSEDGAEVAVSYNTVSQFANPPQIPLSGPCYTEFRSMATGQLSGRPLPDRVRPRLRQRGRRRAGPVGGDR
ncbi:MAG: S8 family serine peptidase [Gemmatimonadetes bacterium]|nr:S8 family serine peptidase [Gemmatimonadota bacterium]